MYSKCEMSFFLLTTELSETKTIQRRRSQMFIAILKNVVLFPYNGSQTPGSPLKEGDKRRGGGGRVAHRVKS